MTYRKLAIRFLSIAFSLLLFDSTALANGETFQLVDREGHDLLEGTYDQLRSCGSGIFIGKRKGDSRQEIYNQKGEKLSDPTPADCNLEELICPWKRSKEAPKELPNDVLLRVSRAGYQGIIDARGNVIVPIEFDNSERIGSDFIIFERVEKDSGSPKSYFFSLATRTLTKKGFTRMLDYAAGDKELIAFCERVVPPSKARDPYHADLNHWEITPDPYNQWGYCDVENSVIVPAQFERASDFHEGFAIVKPKLANIDSTFIDKKGQIIATDIVAMSYFQGGLAVAARVDSKDKKLGLINEKFQFVLPPVYDTLQLVAAGIYAAKSEKNGRFKALTANGKKLFDFPNFVFRVRDHGFGENDDEHIIVVESKDEKDPTKSSGKSALLNDKGKILIPPIYGISQTWFGMAEVHAVSHSSGENLWGVSNFSGEQLIKPQSSCFSIEGPDCLIKMIVSEHFDRDSWKSNYNNRLEDFKKFLKDYDLVGMPYAQVKDLLGRPDEYKGVLEYHLLSSWCAFDVEYKDGKISKWRYNTIHNNGPDDPQELSEWYTTNMVFAPGNDLPEAKLIPKVSSTAK